MGAIFILNYVKGPGGGGEETEFLTPVKLVLKIAICSGSPSNTEYKQKRDKLRGPQFCTITVSVYHIKYNFNKKAYDKSISSDKIPSYLDKIH